MLFSSRVKELESQLALLTTERDSLATNLLTITAERDTALAALATESTKVGDLTTQLADATARIETPEAIEAKVSAAVTARLAAAGAAPIARDPAVTEGSGGTLGEQCAAITDKAEQDKFFAAHRDEILAGL